ncbi:MAG: hypothetical protein FWD57_15210 [Polyangiaceae bacterium]|nr:hypothetical protein [Polyangiaceae bacterium]
MCRDLWGGLQCSWFGETGVLRDVDLSAFEIAEVLEGIVEERDMSCAERVDSTGASLALDRCGEWSRWVACEFAGLRNHWGLANRWLV